MNILITGGATGIGRSVGQLFTDAGHNVFVCGLEERKDHPELPDTFFYFQVDVTDESGLVDVVGNVVRTYGSIDIAIANAGLNMPKTAIPDTKLGKKITDVNINGTLNLFSAVLPCFLSQKSGHFVAMSSLSALNGLPGMSYYGASKAFIASFCESLAIDLIQEGIFVSCIQPGFVKTNFTKRFSHPMPFIMEQDYAAERIYKAILKKKPYLQFPTVPALFMVFLRRLPRSLYYLIMKRDILSLKQQDHCNQQN